MFRIGICIERIQKKEAVTILVRRWVIRQNARIDVRQLEGNFEQKETVIDLLIYDEEYKREGTQRGIFVPDMIEKEELYRDLSREYRQYLSDENSYVYYQRPRYVKTELRNIIYFTSYKRKIIMHCIDGNYEFYAQLNQVEQEVCSKNKDFIRAHQSHLINKEYISKYTPREVILKNGEILTISKNRKKSARRSFYCLSEN